ncbi:MAG: ABC-F family ATP-binding cassette domain-containing protein [bacterium]
MLIQGTNLHKSIGGQAVLAGISFIVNTGDKVGIVGPNGSGKTTLLRLVKREVEPDEGELAFSARPEIGYFRQDVLADAETTVYSAVLGDMENVERRIESVRRELEEDPEDEAALVKLEAFEEEMDTRFGADYRSRAERALAGLGFGKDRYPDAVQTMSPGERARLEMARILIGQPELLLLDEPTNYLDIGQREWLERYLEDYKGTVLVVSHDRVFLNEVANRMFELRRGKLTAYEGGYDDYLFDREQERLRLEREHAEHRKEIAKLDSIARRQDAWSARKEKTKTSAGDSGFVSAAAARLARRGKQAKRRIDEAIEAHEDKTPFIEKKPAPVLFTAVEPGRRAVLVKGLAKSFGTRCVVKGAGFEIRTGEHVALVGPNGCGKTVLVRMLVGELEPDKGTVTPGAAVKVGYFPQDLGTLDLGCTAVEEVMKSGAKQETARTVLGTMLLPKDFAERKLGDLSAGERSKVLLARVLAGGADFLVLDEPTNHLDIDALLALESLLTQFPGAILFASHDRAMLDKLAGRVLELRDGKLFDFPGGWQAFAAQSSKSQSPSPKLQSPKPKAQTSSTKFQTPNPKPQIRAGKTPNTDSQASKRTRRAADSKS